MIDLKYATHNREPFFQIAKDLISSSDRILDIGAGDGKFADFCNRNDMYLYDGNLESVKSLSKRFKNVKHGVLPSLPYEDNFFDLIHMSHVIEHLYPEQVYASLEEMNRCCKDKGRLIISAPLFWSGFYDDLSHIRPYPPESFVKYLTKIGDTASRSLVSNAFITERLQYRYLESRQLFRRRRERKYLDKIIYKLQSILKSPEVIYEKTGFTIVLKKEN